MCRVRPTEKVPISEARARGDAIGLVWACLGGFRSTGHPLDGWTGRPRSMAGRRSEGMGDYRGEARPRSSGLGPVPAWCVGSRCATPVPCGLPRPVRERAECPRSSTDFPHRNWESPGTAWGSGPRWAPAMFSLCYVMLPAAALGTLYLLPYLRGERLIHSASTRPTICGAPIWYMPSGWTRCPLIPVR